MKIDYEDDRDAKTWPSEPNSGPAWVPLRVRPASQSVVIPDLIAQKHFFKLYFLRAYFSEKIKLFFYSARMTHTGFKYKNLLLH